MASGSSRVSVVLRIGVLEEEILHLAWSHEAVAELELYHQVNGNQEMASLLGEQISLSMGHDRGKLVKEAILRMVDSLRPEVPDDTATS